MDLRAFADAATAIPYQDRGRSWAGADCWGLVVLAYREVLGIELPSWTEGYVSAEDRAAVAALIDGGKSAWAKIALNDAWDLDALLLRDGRDLSHVGLLLRGREPRMLHARRGAGVINEPVRNWQPRLAGIYRFGGRSAP